MDIPSEDAILFAFGPDVLHRASSEPALRRFAMLFPGFGFNPFHNQAQKEASTEIISNYYDLVFANPGLVYEALKGLPQIALCPFSIDVELVKCKSYRKRLDSLLHASADYPQKDRSRSEAVMKATGLRYEMFPPSPKPNQSLFQRGLRKLSRYIDVARPRWNHSAKVLPKRYRPHQKLIHKYQMHDGFVHIAAPKPPSLDGKYTATLLEAGLTGAIVFWHDTYKLGNDFTTIFSLPLDPIQAAKEIQDIRRSISVEKHSRMTREEILDRCHPEHVVKIRYEIMRNRL